MNTATVGPILKDWRARRHISQLELAVRVGVSARHLSFVETGRSNPSPELVTALGIELDLPLREQNTMLLAAGYAPRYRETSLDAPESAQVMTAIDTLLSAHDPYPGVAVDRLWNVVASNRSSSLLVDLISPVLLVPPLNVYRVSLHPDGLARHTINLVEWGGHLLRQLRRDLALTGDSRLSDLLSELKEYPTVQEVEERYRPHGPAALLVPLELLIGEEKASFFTTLTTFGTPRDVTLDELVIELFYPADEATERLIDAAGDHGITP